MNRKDFFTKTILGLFAMPTLATLIASTKETSTKDKNSLSDRIYRLQKSDAIHPGKLLFKKTIDIYPSDDFSRLDIITLMPIVYDGHVIFWGNNSLPFYGSLAYENAEKAYREGKTEIILDLRPRYNLPIYNSPDVNSPLYDPFGQFDLSKLNFDHRIQIVHRPSASV